MGSREKPESAAVVGASSISLDSLREEEKGGKRALGLRFVLDRWLWLRQGSALIDWSVQAR